jgi:hypothetical protein
VDREDPLTVGVQIVQNLAPCPTRFPRRQSPALLVPPEGRRGGRVSRLDLCTQAVLGKDLPEALCRYFSTRRRSHERLHAG